MPSETFVNNSRVSLDGTTVNAVVPNTAATGDVKLFGLPDSFFLQIVPRVTTFSNNSDFRPGVNLRLHGNGFIEGGITVHFGDVDVVDPSTSSTTINVHSSGTLMDVTMPSGAGSGVSVTTGGGTSNVFFVGPESFTDLIADANEGTPADSGERSANVGQTITILGSGFRSNTNVSFPSVNDSGAVGTINVRIGGLNVTRTQATVVVPNTAATGEVKLFGLPDSFFLQIVPRITTFSSNSDFRPGVNLRLHGNGFIEGGITVHFGSVDVVDPSTSSTTINVHSSGTLMDVTMPTGADGGMSVTTEGGTSNVFFVGPESFTDLIADANEGTPADSGERSANVGQTITILGSGFRSNTNVSFPSVSDSGVPGTINVRIGGLNADRTEATVVVPNTAATGDVKLVGLPDSFFLQIVPRITTFSSNSDFRPGVNLRLHGGGFIEGGITVHFGSVDVVDPSTSSTTINVHSSGTLMDVTMPTGADGGMSVTTEGGTSNVFFVGPESFTDLIADANEGTPADSGERSANVGQTITILGSGFRSNTNVSFPSVNDSGAVGTINVRIGGLNADRTEATVVVPNTAATGDVKLVGLPDSFFLQIVPRITTFSSNNDFRPGVNLRLHGGGFIEGDITVHFGSVDVVDPSTSSTTINVHSSGTLMDVTMPTGADGGMSVTTEGGTSNVFFVGPESFTDLIAVANIGTPADSGERSANVGQAITLVGSGFRTNTNVSFPSVNDSGTPGFSFVRVAFINSDRTEATVTVPLNAATGEVTVPGTDTSFLLQIVPRITSSSVTGGVLTPGQNLRLNGSGFIEGGSTVALVTWMS